MTKPEVPASRIDPTVRDRTRACLLAGAAGDALGGAVEFLALSDIRKRFGAGGIRDFAPAYGRIGAITDDTQMTLFTAEGMLRAYSRWLGKGICHAPSVIANAYLRWLKTQDEPHPLHGNNPDGWLIRIPELHALRAPGNTCLSTLREMKSLGERAANNSKGCGGVMRVAPIGLWFAAEKQADPTCELRLHDAFRCGVDAAAITHGHPSGQLPAGLFSAVIAQTVHGVALPEALERGSAILRTHSNHEETLRAVEHALELAAAFPEPETIPPELGQGWVAEEALAIGLYAALVAPNLETGVILAVNHGGDSDSTGSIAGNLLGAMHGMDAIPARWLKSLELRQIIEQVADDLTIAPLLNGDDSDLPGVDDFFERYPGH